MVLRGFYVIDHYDTLIDKGKTVGAFNLLSDVKRQFRLLLFQHEESTSLVFTKKPYHYLRNWLTQQSECKVEKLAISEYIYSSSEAKSLRRQLVKLISNVNILNFETKLADLAKNQNLEIINCNLEDLIQLFQFLTHEGKLKIPSIKKDEILENLTQDWTKRIIYQQIFAVRSIYNPQANQRQKIYRPSPTRFITKSQTKNWFMMSTDQVKFLIDTFVIEEFQLHGHRTKLSYRDLNKLRINCNLIYKTLKGEFKNMDNTHILNAKVDELHFHKFQDLQATTKLTRKVLLEQMIDQRYDDPKPVPTTDTEKINQKLNEIVRSVNRLNSVVDRQNKILDLVLANIESFM